ncbi:MAG TPA: hypothetical protein VNH19_10445 [Candidatus Limnocylindrales bacterium]|nr:hypothetical protein [Candidatus Limnocylindrales bacterium]
MLKLIAKKAFVTGGKGGTSLATAQLFIVVDALVAITGRGHKTLDEKT